MSYAQLGESNFDAPSSLDRQYQKHPVKMSLFLPQTREGELQVSRWQWPMGPTNRNLRENAPELSFSRSHIFADYSVKCPASHRLTQLTLLRGRAELVSTMVRKQPAYGTATCCPTILAHAQTPGMRVPALYALSCHTSRGRLAGQRHCWRHINADE